MTYGVLNVDTVQSSTAATAPVFKDGNGTQIGTLCRAWVNFNGSTGAVLASFNVGSVTRNGTGDYTANFTNAMPDANYSFALSCQGTSSINQPIVITQNSTTNPQTTGLRVLIQQTTTAIDRTPVSVAVFR